MIELRAITLENWRECASLSLNPDQREFLPDNIYSIAESQFYPDCRPLAIYNHLGQMVGFVMYGQDIVLGKWKVFRLMIDARHQGQGYAKGAMQAVIARIGNERNGNEILIAYRDDNRAARRLYAKLGFVEQVKESNGRVIALLKQVTFTQ